MLSGGEAKVWGLRRGHWRLEGVRSSGFES